MKLPLFTFLCVVHVVSGCGDITQIQDFDSALNLVQVKLSFEHAGVMMSAGSVLNLSCDNVYSASSPGDWTQNNVSATTTFSLVHNKNCHVVLVSYNDGTNTYTDTGTRLNIAVSNSGVVSAASALQYTSGGGSPILKWFAAAQGQTTYSMVINYTDNTVSSSTVAKTNLTSQAVSLSAAPITSPTVSSLTLYSIPAINGASISYTLTASVSGYTACKLIDNTSGTYTPTSWSSVNTAYNAATTSCPTMVDGQVGFSIGNWTSYWVSGQKTLVMWANSLNGFNAYAVANIGP